MIPIDDVIIMTHAIFSYQNGVSGLVLTNINQISLQFALKSLQVWAKYDI